MPTQQFELEPKGPKRLEVSWTGIWNELTVKVDGKKISTYTNEELKQGVKMVALPDGTIFKAELRRIGMGRELVLSRNGVPLPGSGADPVQLVQTTSGLLYLIAGYEALLGTLGIAGIAYFRLRGFGATELVVAAVCGACGYFTRKRSRFALLAGLLTYLADAI